MFSLCTIVLLAWLCYFVYTFDGSLETQRMLSRGGEVVSRLAHNQETAGAIPAPATIT